MAQPTLPITPPQPGDSTSSSPATISAQIGNGLSGSYLIQYLRDYFYYSQSSGKNYDNSRQYLYSKVDIIGDQVFCLYTGFTATYDSTTIPDSASKQVYLNGDGINAEHIWPQSKFNKKSPMVYDLHHLFASQVQANGDRSNYPFMNISEGDVTYWYLNDSRLTVAPESSQQHLYSKYKSGAGFEPRDQYKGDVARAIFYFYTMYKDNANMLADTGNPAFFDGMKTTLLEWHRKDPSDSVEKARNTKVAAWQGNRNPFIDDSSLVARVFFKSDAYSVNFAGDSKGWRMSGLPFNLTYSNVYSTVFTQGFAGATTTSGVSTIQVWNTALASFESISAASANANHEQGHIIYLFEDDDLNSSGIQGGFPKSVSVGGFTVSTSATMRLQAPDLNSSSSINYNEGWVLLQNPFDRSISVSKMIDALEAASSKTFNQNVYIWNAKNLSYDTFAANSTSFIAPFQGFWVKLDQIVASNTDVVISRSSVESDSSRLLQKIAVKNPTIQLLAFDGHHSSQLSFVMDETASNLYDSNDAFFLQPFDINSIQFYSLDDENIAYQHQFRNLNEEDFIRIPVHLSNIEGAIKVNFEGFDSQQFEVFWSDGNQEFSLNDDVTFPVSVSGFAQESFSPGKYKPILKNGNPSNYSLLIKRSTSTSIENRISKPSSISISEAFPNPFNPSTSFQINGDYKGQVSWTVYSALGQRIENNSVNKINPSQQIRLDFNKYAAGMYLVQFRFGKQEFQMRKVLLIK